MRRSIVYGDERIAFTIRFVPRRNVMSPRRIAISVLPDGAVTVEAPEASAPQEVVAAVYRRARWIWQQLAACRERRRHVLPRDYVSGESHFYLGRRHVLKVSVTACAPAGVKLLRGRLEVTTPTPVAGDVRRLLDAWYRQRAQEVFSRRLAALADELRWLESIPAFRLLSMRTQWGSCSPGGVLCLNPQLVKAPRACIDYVIAHELCHLRVHNHSAAYYRLLTACMPDWKLRKQELDGIAEVLLNQ